GRSMRCARSPVAPKMTNTAGSGCPLVTGPLASAAGWTTVLAMSHPIEGGGHGRASEDSRPTVMGVDPLPTAQGWQPGPGAGGVLVPALPGLLFFQALPTAPGGRSGAAAVRASPVARDRAAPVARACALIGGGGRLGARLAVFPETFIPAYPDWVWQVPVS